jgi:hypothetical protein
MKLKSLKDISTKVIAEVRDGSLIHLDETKVAEIALGKSIEWTEVPDSRETAGNYFQCLYEAILPNHEAKIAKQAIVKYRNPE